MNAGDARHHVGHDRPTARTFSDLDRATEGMSSGYVQLWRADPATIEASLAEPTSARRLLNVLDPAERARARLLQRQADRARFVAGAITVRVAVAAHTGEHPSRVRMTRKCHLCGGSHGVPHPTGPGGRLRVSVSHSGDTVLVAVTAGQRVGVDVESLVRQIDVDPLLDTLAQAEAFALKSIPPDRRSEAFLTVWTRKEAVAKALGVGLNVAFDSFVVSEPAMPPRLISWPGDAQLANRTSMAQLNGAGYVACLVVIGALDRVDVRDAAPSLHAAATGAL